MQEKPITPSTSDRKLDHIDLAFRADMAKAGTDPRFYYEPMLAGHPDAWLDLSISFLGKKLNAPLWVSSMTGGTEKAFTINRRLAEACARFGLGMGLGSCRPLLESQDRLVDFDLRPVMGDDLPLYANLGIAQVEELITSGNTAKMEDLIGLLRADGLIIHVNPLQEWLQPEGDQIRIPPIETIQTVLEAIDFPIIVKEVGQGMGPASLRALLSLPIAAFEYAAHGGTNFSRLELLRSENQKRDTYHAVSHLGHTIDEMTDWIRDMQTDTVHAGDAINRVSTEASQQMHYIVSGGIKDFLDGYYHLQRLGMPAIYGQASGFLKYATESQEALDTYIHQQIEGLKLAHTYLRLR